MNDTVAAFVSAYYTQKLMRFGETPQGVDWNSEFAQQIRFDQVLSVLRPAERYTVNDFGCGYGALFDRIREHRTLSAYVGFDISVAMVSAASARCAGDPRARFVNVYEQLPVADYTVASGIFGVKGPTSLEDWRSYAFATIDTFANRSRCGYAFNCLTGYSDPERKREDLFYADPHEMFDYCRTRHSRNVAILHDYGLYEFTVRVRLD